MILFNRLKFLLIIVFFTRERQLSAGLNIKILPFLEIFFSQMFIFLKKKSAISQILLNSSESSNRQIILWPKITKFWSKIDQCAFMTYLLWSTQGNLEYIECFCTIRYLLMYCKMMPYHAMSHRFLCEIILLQIQTHFLKKSSVRVYHIISWYDIIWQHL